MPWKSFLEKAQEGKIIETAALMNQPFTFFYRQGNKEVDFVDKDAVPVEVKYAHSIPEKDLQGLLTFLKKNNAERGIVISKETDGEQEMKGKKILFIPLWKWLLQPLKSDGKV